MADRVDEQLIQLGQRLVRAYFVVSKTAANYAPGHPALEAPCAELVEVVREYERRHEEARLGLHEDHLFAGEHRAASRTRPGFDAFFTTMRQMKRCGIGGLVFTARADAAAVQAWFALLREVDAAPAEDPFAALAGRMEPTGIVGIEVERPVERVAPSAATEESGSGRRRSTRRPSRSSRR